jgi:ribosome-binding factor A
LAADEDKFTKMREELDRKMSKMESRGGEQVFRDKTMYSPPPVDESKRSIDREMNLLKSGAELSDRDNLYYIGTTKVPDHLEHWLMDPMGLKSPRDSKIVKKLQGMKLKTQQKKLKGNSRDTSSAGTVTQRMARIQSMLLREMNSLLGDLPSAVAAGSPDAFAPDEHHAGIISSALVHITRTEVTRDLMQARFYWDCVPGQRNAVDRELRRITPQLRYMLQQLVKMKYAPDIHFEHDSATLREMDVERRLDTVEDELSRSGMLLSDDRVDIADEKSPRSMAKKSARPALDPGIRDPEAELAPDATEEASATGEPEEPAPAPPKPRERKFFGPQKPFDFRDKSRQLIETYEGPMGRSRKYL